MNLLSSTKPSTSTITYCPLPPVCIYHPLTYKKRFYLFIFGRGEGREKERERNISVWLPLMHPPLGSGHNLGMCPDWESNQPPFGSQAGTQCTEPQQPGPSCHFLQTIVLHMPKQHSVLFCLFLSL